MNKLLIFVVCVTTLELWAVSCQQIVLETRQNIPYEMAFSQKSLVTVVMLACNDDKDYREKDCLKKSFGSFFYYNTYPIKELIIVDRCDQGENFITSFLPQSILKSQNYIKMISIRNGFVTALDKAFSYVRTKYVYLIPECWVTTRGFGLLDGSVDVLQYAEKSGLKISQTTQLYLFWGEYRYLGRMQKTNKATKFHEIKTFKPSQRYYITLNPSLLNFKVIYEYIGGRDLVEFSKMNNCEYMQNRECVQKKLSLQLYEKRAYFQAFVNDGSQIPNSYKIK